MTTTVRITDPLADKHIELDTKSGLLRLDITRPVPHPWLPDHRRTSQLHITISADGKIAVACHDIGYEMSMVSGGPGHTKLTIHPAATND